MRVQFFVEVAAGSPRPMRWNVLITPSQSRSPWAVTVKLASGPTPEDWKR